MTRISVKQSIARCSRNGLLNRIQNQYHATLQAKVERLESGMIYSTWSNRNDSLYNVYDQNTCEPIIIVHDSNDDDYNHYHHIENTNQI